MTARNKKFLYAVTTLIGTIVGVGMFGIPYAVSKSGISIGIFYFIALGLIVVFLHLLYGEVVARTRVRHRFVGYAEKYLGLKGKIFAVLSVMIGLYGALLAYIIVGGKFLGQIFSPLFGGSEFAYSMIFFAIGAFVIYKGANIVYKLEFSMSFFLIAVVFLIFVFGSLKIDFENFRAAGNKDLFLPYGVILFAVTGLTAVAELKEILKDNGQAYKKAIILGSSIPIALYFIFTFTVMGITGQNTSEESFSGLSGILGDKILILGAFFGFLAVITSFFTIGLNLKKTFWYDFKISRTMSWLVTVTVPLILYLLRVHNFIAVIMVVGAVLGGIEGTLIILMNRKARRKGDRVPEYSVKLPVLMQYGIMALLILGMAYQVYYFLK